MGPRVSLVTLGVSDLKRAVAFYRDGLGWPKSDVGGVFCGCLTDELWRYKTGEEPEQERLTSSSSLCLHRTKVGTSCQHSHLPCAYKPSD